MQPTWCHFLCGVACIHTCGVIALAVAFALALFGLSSALQLPKKLVSVVFVRAIYVMGIMRH